MKKAKLIAFVLVVVVLAGLGSYFFQGGDMFQGRMKLNLNKDVTSFSTDGKTDDSKKNIKITKGPQKTAKKSVSKMAVPVSKLTNTQDTSLEEVSVENVVEDITIRIYKSFTHMGSSDREELLDKLDFVFENYEDLDSVSRFVYYFAPGTGSNWTNWYNEYKDCEVLDEERFFALNNVSSSNNLSVFDGAHGMTSAIRDVNYFDVENFTEWDSFSNNFILIDSEDSVRGGWYHFVVHGLNSDGAVVASSGVKSVFYHPSAKPHIANGQQYYDAVMILDDLERSGVCASSHSL